jgi:hypothetical protein
VKQAVELTVYGKHGKTMNLFSHPSHRPWKSLTSDSHIPTTATTTGINDSQNFNVPEVGQNKMPKWAKPACQTQAVSLLA